MDDADDREFDEWLGAANQAFTESVAAGLDLPELLDQVKCDADGPLLTKTDIVDLNLGSRATPRRRYGTRDQFAQDTKRKYERGASIRAIAESTGRSCGFVHRVLSEAGVTLRGRGGATRTKKQ
ncbi:MAG TPA: helix-turn-helix domain-containing protein [Kribbella sp.]